jgi:DNA-binding response OmpR family regulator
LTDATVADHLLLVEDDARFASLVEQHLRARGYQVTRADSLAAATEAFRALAARGDSPDLVLLDINLPDDAGWGLLADPGYATAGAPPVVVMTATTVSPRRLRERGIAGCLTKPFAMETLRSTIDRVLHPEGSPST